MAISEILPVRVIPKSSPMKPLHNSCIMVAVASFSLVIGFVPAGTPAATTALASMANLAPCGDTPGFCPVIPAELSKQFYTAFTKAVPYGELASA